MDQTQGPVDDTERLQALLDAPGPFRPAPGTYRLLRPLVIELAKCGPFSVAGEGGVRLVMAGPGPALRVVGTHQRSADPTGISAGVWLLERMPLLDGLEIVGEHPEADGVELTGTLQATLSRLLIRECRHGIRIAERNRNVVVSDCHLYHNRGVGLFLDRVNLHQINVHGCHISYNGGGGIVVRGSEVRNLQVVGNDIEYNFDRAAAASADLWIEVQDRSVREVCISGNTIQALPSPGGANVRVVGTSAEARHKAGLINITGNLITSQETNVHLQWVRGVVIGGNTFGSAAEHALHAVECSTLALGCNVFDRNPDYPQDTRDGILLERCRGAHLEGFQMDRCLAGSPESGGCIEVRDCEDVAIRGVQILNAEHRAIEIRDSRNCTVGGSHIRDRRPQPSMRHAIRVTGGGGNYIAGNFLGNGRSGALHLEAGAGLAEHNHVL